MTWRFNPADYKVGDPIYVSYSRGWNRRGVTRYLVTRVTPKGQIVAKNDTREIRFTARGSVVGQSGYQRVSVVSAEQARELITEIQEEARGETIRGAWHAIELAARKMNEDALQAALATIASAMSARQGHDPQGHGAEPASAVTAQPSDAKPEELQ